MTDHAPGWLVATEYSGVHFVPLTDAPTAAHAAELMRRKEVDGYMNGGYLVLNAKDAEWFGDPSDDPRPQLPPMVTTPPGGNV